MTYASTEQAVEALARGELVVLVNDVERDSEGALLFAAEAATPEKVGFTVRHTSGVVRTTLTAERANELHLAPMVADVGIGQRNAFTISVDYLRGSAGGVSALDRANTLRALADPRVGACEFSRPGHVFPVRAQAGGVLSQASSNEAAYDLVRLSGLRPYGVVCELLAQDGSIARQPALHRFAHEHSLPLTTIGDLVHHRRRSESWVVPVSESLLPTPHGTFHARAYRSELDQLEHVALYMGQVHGADDIPVRVHSECITSEVFGSLRCDCRDQLESALRDIARSGQGILVYMRGHEGRGIGLGNKLKAYALQDRGVDTVQANLDLGLPIDARRYDAAAHILRDLAPRSVRLMSNNPEKFEALESCGIAITRRVRLQTRVSEHNREYLRSKQEKLGHDLVFAPSADTDSLHSVAHV